jgi:hypothetical protein
MRCFLRAALAALFLAGKLWTTDGQTFTNGGFESVNGPAISPGDSMNLNAGDTWLPGWSTTVTNDSVMVQNGAVGFYEGSDLYGLGPFQGNQWLVFPNDDTGGSIFQNFTTSIGSYCTVSLESAYVYAADNPFLTATIRASDGSVLTNVTYPLSYRVWTSNQFSFIATTTNTTLILADASTNAEGAFIGLDAVALNAEPPGWPYITMSPTNQTNGAGTLATFSASAGGAPSSVQWYLGSNPVPGATNTVLTVLASLTNAGIYTAVFSNSVGSSVSLPAVLTVLQVINSPANQTAARGDVVQFNVAANLAGATVQWFRNGSFLPAAMSPSLSLVAGNQTAGTYVAQFTLGSATAVSGPATLVVTGIPFVNGSFETTNGTFIPSGGDQALELGDVWLNGWTSGGTNDEVFVFNGAFNGLQAVNGQQWVVFDSENAPPAGQLSQTFATAIGQSYLVTYAAVAVYDDGAPAKSLEASATASDGSLLAENIIVPSAIWLTNQFTFTATSINSTVVFTDLSAPSIGPSVALDAVNVVAQNSGTTNIYTLTVVDGSNSNSIVLQAGGPAGQSVVLQTSTNLMTWIPVLTNLLTGQPLNLTNALTPGKPAQYWSLLPAGH